MRKGIIMLMFFVAMVCCAYGADTAQTAVGGAIKGVITDTVMPLLISLVSTLVSVVLFKVKQKLNISLSAETEDWINRQAENAVQLVAEKAAAKLKLEQITISSNDKLNVAIAFLITKVPKLTEAQADTYIHAALARIPGIGATGDKSLVPGNA